MGSRLRKAVSILIFLLVLIFYSCLGLLDTEEFKEYSLNSEYKIFYVKLPNEKLDGVTLLTQENMGIIAVSWLAYNNNYIYLKTMSDRCYQLKINLKSKEIGDYKTRELSKEEFDDLVSKCKDCIILDMETLNIMDKDIPPLPPGGHHPAIPN